MIAHFYDKQRIVVPSANIADVMKKAIIAIEDKRFYEHNGVDATGIARAFVTNLGDSGRQGASTITQQYVRNSLAERGYLEGDADQVSAATEQTTERKLREIKYAMALEKTLSKDEILTGYPEPLPPSAPSPTASRPPRSATSRSRPPNWTTWRPRSSPASFSLPSSTTRSPTPKPPRNAETRSWRPCWSRASSRRKSTTKVSRRRSTRAAPDRVLRGCSGAESSKAYFCDYVLAQFLEDPTFGATRVERERLLKTQASRSAPRWIPRCRTPPTPR